MSAYRYILLTLFALGLALNGCAPAVRPTVSTAQPEPTVASIQQAPTTTAFIGIPKISDPLIQPDNESKEEFIIRIAATKIISKRPFLIALSQIGKENLWFGVSRDIKDIEKCWIYEVDSTRQCTSEDLRNYLGNQKALKIFFAFAYSNSTEELFVLDYYRPWIEDDTIEDTMDGYRLVIELKDGKWVVKSLTQVY